MLRDDVAIDPIYRERFRREGRMLASLNHPHVIPIYGMGEIDGQLYIATRLTASTLKDLIVAGPIAVDDAITILAAVADALDAAHAAGVIHRDIKPANVLMDPGPRLPDRLRARARPRRRRAHAARPGARDDRLHGARAAGGRAHRPGDRHLRAGLPGRRDPHGPGALPARQRRRHDLRARHGRAAQRVRAPARAAGALDDVIAAGMAKYPDDRPATAGTLIADMLRALDRPARRAGRDRLRRLARRCRRRSRPTGRRRGRFDGRYEVVAPISSGAMGAVYRALDREDGREVAVKRLLDVRHAARFEIEARLLASLSHPRLVKVLDHASDEQGAYIVMDLVRGIDLGAVLKRDGDPGLTLGDGIEYARHACEALQYVHEQQIVHRDVKPPNMILGDDGVVLVDFGVARALGGEQEEGTIAVGTPRFMAPEVLAGGTVSAASDVYSLAATLWTLLIGTPPRYGDAPKLDKLAPEIDPELREALASGLQLLPEERIASAAAFAEAIGAPLTAGRGESLAQSLGHAPIRRRVMEAIVRTAAGMFDAAACSIALTDPASGELVYEAAWGAGAAEVVGLRLPPGAGLAGTVVASGEGVVVPECRKDPRLAPRSPPRPAMCPTPWSSRRSCARARRSASSRCSTAATASPTSRGPRARRPVRRPRRRRARPRRLPAQLARRAHAPWLTCPAA